jgi:hypothetical protein
MKTAPAVLMLVLAAAGLSAQDPKPPAGALALSSAPARGVDDSTLRRVETASKGDGFMDDVVYFNEKGQKVREEFDYNRDGKMDDFLYYENGLLVREEIDTRYEGKIDVWVYISGGAYVEKYAKDTDGDGVPDFVKDFNKKK